MKMLDIPSPLPFGVHRVHHTPTNPRTFSLPAKCFHCLSAFSAFTTAWSLKISWTCWTDLHCLSAFNAFTTNPDRPQIHQATRVSIAFRRSPRSPPQREMKQQRDATFVSPLPFGVLRVDHLGGGPSGGGEIAVSNSIRRSARSPRNRIMNDEYLQHDVSIAFRRSPRSPHWGELWHYIRTLLSPLPFGVLRVHHLRHDCETICREAQGVSIAFRRSPRSPLFVSDDDNSAIYRSPLPFGVHRVHHPSQPLRSHPDTLSLHCLSAFTTFTYTTNTTGIITSPLPFGVHRVHHDLVKKHAAKVVRAVSIACRRSPHPPPHSGGSCTRRC